MFGISGDVGDDLLETLAKQAALKQQQEEMRMRAQQIAEQQRQFNENLALQRQREENDQGRHRDDVGLRTRAIDLDELQRRDRNNETGLAQMTRDRAAWEGEQQGRGLDELANDPNLPPAIRTIIGLQRRGVSGVRPDDLEDPAARSARELQDFEARERIQSRYRAPAGGGSGERQEWVIRNGQPTPIARGTAQAGDKPYDAVAARQGAPASSEEAMDTAREVQRIAYALRNHEGLPAAFGVLQSRLPTFDQDTANAEVLAKSLMSLLTLENTGKLKGVLSNADMEVLRRASSTISPEMGDAAAAAELDRIVQVMSKVTGENPNGGQAAPGGAPAGGPAVGEVRMINGQRGKWDGHGWVPVP